MIDGVEANADRDGEFDFSNLLTEDIERIEVIRGPQSGLYGSKAVGGVINIITKSGSGPLSLTVRAEGGSLGTTRLRRARVGRHRSGLARRSAHQYRDTDGFNNAPFGCEEDAWQNSTVSLAAASRS